MAAKNGAGSAAGRAARSRPMLAACLAGLSAAALTVPGVGLPCVAAGAWLLWKRWDRESGYPLRMPVLPDRRGRPFGKALRPEGKDAGIFFIGNEKGSRREMWLSGEDACRHWLVAGTSGAAKSEFLLGLGAGAIGQGGGLIYVDGLGSVSMFASIYAMCRAYRREDDLVVLNFLASPGGHSGASHRLNPFLSGDGNALGDLLLSMLGNGAGEGSDAAQVRLRLLTRGMMCALCWLRDECGLPLDAAAVASRLPLEALSELAENGDIPEAARASLRDYLSSLPSYGADRDRQSPGAHEQHNASAMALNEMLSTMRDAYGHVFCAGGSDVDMRDVLENRRVLMVLLPSGMCGDASASFGRLVLAILAAGLKGRKGGAIPGGGFSAVLDDCGRYLIAGMDGIGAAASRAGMSMVYGGQVADMKRRNPGEAASVIGGTGVKAIMRTEEFEAPDRISLMDLKSAGPPDPISFMDLKSQEEGEMHLVYKDEVFRAKCFYANPRNRNKAPGFRAWLSRNDANFHGLVTLAPGIDGSVEG